MCTVVCTISNLLSMLDGNKTIENVFMSSPYAEEPNSGRFARHKNIYKFVASSKKSPRGYYSV